MECHSKIVAVEAALRCDWWNGSDRQVTAWKLGQGLELVFANDDDEPAEIVVLTCRNDAVRKSKQTLASSGLAEVLGEFASTI